MNIDRIRIVGFKSIADLTLESLTPYSVFAGANGSGKSNLMDALAFVGSVIESGAKKAISRFGGFSQIHCFKFQEDRARTFEFYMDGTNGSGKFSYEFKIHAMDTAPVISEKLTSCGKILFDRVQEREFEINFEEEKNFKNFIVIPASTTVIKKYPADLSCLMISAAKAIYVYLTNIRVFRFDPLGAKEPDERNADEKELHPHGHNVATVLAAMEKNSDFRKDIVEWMEFLVPGMEKISADRNRLDGRMVIQFKEKGIDEFFPANLISDGTIYALCLITAVLTRSSGLGMTLIEEPERGIHPNAISELVNLMRGNATPGQPVFVTTHSESVVRAAKIDELWLADKRDGKTIVKRAAIGTTDLGSLNLDKAWLMNFFGAGLPW